MWNIATPSGFGDAVRHTAAFIRPNRNVRDLSGLPAVLGRFGPVEGRLATTRREIRKAQRLRFKVFLRRRPRDSSPTRRADKAGHLPFRQNLRSSSRH
jgi:putative hemolysin